ncbi:hypothetical protein ACH82I_07975 [Brevibacterium sp. GP-SGM9]|nr:MULTISPECIES: hypothetical protein [unclassified Brevibacterium]MDK8436665.1 hypothetical protein [Brevibacterium sp. H-BE7]
MTVAHVPVTVVLGSSAFTYAEGHHCMGLIPNLSLGFTVGHTHPA